ncbi:phosphotransferase [Acrocarpospora catenulata]|uniref:phosphotransferase n=1 Tax=Acrocarpospora catenulata TaxID=2836182 RepID=UPI001BDA97C8|nr:phosphotransferase [Acrocarpospora catenulata]
MTRPTWDDLPGQVRDAVTAEAGDVLKAESASQGLMPGTAIHLHVEGGGQVFLKAVADDNPAAPLYQREMWAGAVLPEAVPAPRMTWSARTGGWLVMLFEYIDGRGADLSPGSPDLPLVLGTVAGMHRILTPCPAAAPFVADNVTALLRKGAHMLGPRADMVPDQAMYERALDGFDIEDLAGETLLHYDLHPGNLRMTDRGVYVIDWSFASRGAAWVDGVMLAPRLIEAGHTPEQAEGILSLLPGWQDAPARAVTALAALWTLFRIYKAEFGPAEAREHRARAATAGRAWVEYRNT